MTSLFLSPETLVSDMLDYYPLVSGILLKMGLACVGCPINHLCTLEEVCEIYRLEWAAFIQRLAPGAQHHDQS